MVSVFRLSQESLFQFGLKNFMLAVIVGSAMIINLTAAALSGTLVPIILKRIRVDPAVAGLYSHHDYRCGWLCLSLVYPLYY